MKNSCDPIENVPSWFDRVCNLVWYEADAYVRVDCPITFTFYPVCYPDFHIKIPTNLEPSYASEISHLKA